MFLQVDKNVSNSYLEASQGTFHWAYTDSPGCHQVAARDFQCQKFVVKIQKLDVWRTLAATGVKGYMNRVTYVSQVMRPWGPLMPYTPQMLPQQILSEMSNQNLKKVNFWCVDEGALPPTTPINPYLEGNAWKKWGHFLIINPFTHTLESPAWS